MMKENRMKKNKHGQTSVSCHTNTDISLQNDTMSNSVNPFMLQKNNLGLKPFIFILALTAATSEMTEVDSSIDMLEIDKGTAALRESNVYSPDLRYTEFRIRDGVLAKTNAESLNEWFQKVKAFLTKELTAEDKMAFELEEPPKRPPRKEYVETFYVKTIVNFDSESPCDLYEYKDAFKTISDKNVGSKQNNHYSGQLGLLVTPLDHTSNAKFSMIYNGIDKLWSLIDKFHEIMIDNLHNIGYEMIKGELINQLQIVLYSEMTKKYENDEELNSAASTFVDDLIKNASKFTPNDALFGKESLERCARYSNGSWYKSDIKKYAKDIGAEQFVDEIEYPELFKYLASKKYKDNIKEYIRNLVPGLLPIIRDEKNKASLVNVFVQAQKSVHQKLNGRFYPNYKKLTTDYVYDIMNQSDNVAFEAKLIQEFDLIPKILAESSLKQKEMLSQKTTIKSITRIFSHCQGHDEIYYEPLAKVFMDSAVFNECSEHYAHDFDEKVVVNGEIKLPLGRRNEHQIQYNTIYGVTYSKLGDNNLENYSVSKDDGKNAIKRKTDMENEDQKKRRTECNCFFRLL